MGETSLLQKFLDKKVEVGLDTGDRLKGNLLSLDGELNLLLAKTSVFDKKGRSKFYADTSLVRGDESIYI